jgi:REP element-mobilizing transposase RayT
MARQKRVQHKGIHYISNRSVELRSAFIVQEDYRVFIELLCELSKTHEFTIHSYTLLPHSYHLLIETKKENLSALMRLLNSKYTQYFNLKYGRNGALWEGRYKSSFMQDKSYIFYFIAYMENLPKMIGITSELRNYTYSSYRQFVGLDECLSCIKDSIIFKKFNSIEEIKNFFKKMRNKEFIDNIIEILRKKNLEKNVSKKFTKEKNIEEFFLLNQNRDRENANISKAYKSGFSQRKIGDFLGMSQQAIYLRIKEFRLKNNLK